MMNDDSDLALIYEAVVSTVSAAGQVHIAPMGIRYEGADRETVVLMPFKPSTTLENITSTGHAVLNTLTDVRVIAGCVTGRKQWPTVPAEQVPGVRLAAALGHAELRLVGQQDDAQRPVLRLARVHTASHGWFHGLNRAQAAVVEGAVLISRLHMLPAEKIDTEMKYLQIAIDKTAGPAEHEAWGWLQEAVEVFRASRG